MQKCVPDYFARSLVLKQWHKVKCNSEMSYFTHYTKPPRRVDTRLLFTLVNARRFSGDKALSECRSGELTGERDTFRRTRLYALTSCEKVGGGGVGGTVAAQINPATWLNNSYRPAKSSARQNNPCRQTKHLPPGKITLAARPNNTYRPPK